MLGAKGKENTIVDNTETNLTAHRRTIYLTFTILNFDFADKLMKNYNLDNKVNSVRRF